MIPLRGVTASTRRFNEALQLYLTRTLLLFLLLMTHHPKVFRLKGSAASEKVRESTLCVLNHYLPSLYIQNSPSLTGNTMAAILSFPPELWVLLMTHCDSPIDLNSLIHASPNALRHFFAKKRSILKSHVKAIRATCGSIPTAALLAARLRHARQK